MTYQVRILRRAQHDLLEIQRYASRAAPQRAAAFVDGLIDSIEALAETPGRGTTPRDDRLRHAGYRYLVHAPYLIFYKVLKRQVRVYRVLHGKRAYDQIL